MTHLSVSTDAGLNSSTFVDLLRARAATQHDKPAYTFLFEQEEDHLTYGGLDAKARAIASMLQEAGAAGERVLLLYPPGLDYIAAFFGSLYAGAIAVPAYPPRPNHSLLRLQTIIGDAQPGFALTTSDYLARTQLLSADTANLKALRWLCTDTLDSNHANLWTPPAIDGDTIAFLQYTSGSTATPKGVVISHGNLLHNEQLMKTAFGQTEESVIVSWLPLYHDMGLIGAMLQPVHAGARCILMSPLTFLQNPMRWLEVISAYRATTSGAPNFAYELCAQRASAAQCEQLDLSCWSVAFNGSEPVRSDTLDRFAQTFEPYGFRREAFFPCYGLAEATLFVSGKKSNPRPVLTTVKFGRELEQTTAEQSLTGEATKTLVSCGDVSAEQGIIIVNPETCVACEPSEEGEIWVESPSVAKGYWNLPEETEKTFGARLSGSDARGQVFLRTGDLGLIRDGELYVSGRLKDLIIIRGVNHYPQDIELTVERRSKILRANSGAAFAFEADGEERLAVVHEIERHHAESPATVFEDIRQAIAEEHEIEVAAIALIKGGGLPRTSSGKVKRYACRLAFLNGSLPLVAEWHREPRGEVDATNSGAPAIVETPANLEEWLKNFFAAKLGLDPGSIDPNLPVTRYGLDSLTAIQLTHELETRHGVRLKIDSLLQGLGIRQIAAGAMQPHSQNAAHIAFESETANLRKKTHPLSAGQKALWFIQRVSPDNAAYHIVGAVTIRGALDSQALRRAFQALVERHPSLRTEFVEKDGEPLARIREHRAVSFVEEDASAWTLEQLRERSLDVAYHPFDLQSDALLRIALYRRAPDEHALILAVHHIVADFWSLAILLHELRTEYAAIIEGKAPGHALLRYQYADYARWQSRWLASDEGEKVWHYWQNKLDGKLPLLSLPTDGARPPVQTYKGASHPFAINSELTRKLKAFSRTRDTTLYTTLLAAFQILLHRYTNQADILVGSPMAGRVSGELSGVVGYFVNPVVLRADFSADPSFGDFLEQARQTVIEALAHPSFPFPTLVERLQPERDPSFPPLFQAMFVLQKSHVAAMNELAAFALGESGARMSFAGLELESAALEQRFSQFDLTFAVAEHDDRLTASLQYNSDLFAAHTIARMALHFQTLLAEIIEHPAAPVSTHSLLSEDERRQLLFDWNETQTVYPKEARLHQLVEAQVERTPGAVAVVFEGAELTYRELNERANQLAHQLKHLGVAPDVPVAICMERSLEMVVGLLAILKAGGAYVPLDPDYPPQRLAFMLQDLQVRVLLVQEQLSEKLPACDAHVFSIDSNSEILDGQSRLNPASEVDGNHLAYIIYTSGSTGQPKGAMNTHEAICNRLLWMQETYQLTSADRVLQKTPYSFDVSVWEFFWPLMTGATLILARPGGHQDAAYLVRLIARQNITTLHFVPSMLKVFLEAHQVEKCRSVRQVICSGEALSVDLQNLFFQRLGSELHNLYGPTEAAVDVTFWHCERVSQRRTVPIGRPISNTQMYILDRNLQPVPAGIPGELHIGGIALGRGYLHRSDLTAEKFIPHPFSRSGGERLYRTGDVARYLEDGNIEYVGRADTQVKVRGNRIELGEIEAVLRSHEAILESIVTVREEISGDPRLVAYVVFAGGLKPSWSALRTFLRERLPEYMMPAAFISLDALPLMPNGKSDRNALPAPDWSRQEVAVDFIAPRTPLEATLANIWSNMLGIEQIGVHDNFFLLGGHSLLMTQVISQVREALGIEIPLRSFFQSPTIAGLADIVEAAGNAPHDPEEVNDLLDMLEHMSQEEVEEFLRNNGNGETLNLSGS